MEPKHIESLLNAEKIGLFDSGLGGLSVLKSFIHNQAALSTKEFIYIGDTKRCPYGDRSRGEIKEFVGQLTDWLVKEGAEAIVMACNTSAALLGPGLERDCPVKVFNLLMPTAQYIKKAGITNVGVIATRSTANSRAFSRAVDSLGTGTRVTELGCPDLVPLVESGLADHARAKAALKPYAERLLEEGAEAIVFGCTHYPFLRNSLIANLEQLTSRKIELIDPARVLMRTVRDASPKTTATKEAKLNIATTGNAREFAEKASLLLGIDSDRIKVRTITLGELELAKPIQLQKPSAVEQMERRLKSLANSVTGDTISPAPIP